MFCKIVQIVLKSVNNGPNTRIGLERSLPEFAMSFGLVLYIIDTFRVLREVSKSLVTLLAQVQVTGRTVYDDQLFGYIIHKFVSLRASYVRQNTLKLV